MKRYKVVQDSNRHWGIHDTYRTNEFASWGRDAWQWRYVVACAVNLNTGWAQRSDFEWTFYEPRKENR